MGYAMVDVWDQIHHKVHTLMRIKYSHYYAGSVYSLITILEKREESEFNRIAENCE